jgi:sulfur carrier protein ThiS
MQIRVKLGGDLKRHGASGLQEIESDGPLTVARAMDLIGVGADAENVLVIVNDEIVPPGEQSRFELKENDRLALMPQLRGG